MYRPELQKKTFVKRQKPNKIKPNKLTDEQKHKHKHKTNRHGTETRTLKLPQNFKDGSKKEGMNGNKDGKVTREMR